MDIKNSISKQIEKLKDSCSLYSEYVGHCMFYKPVTREEIKFWEQENETVLPESLKEMLLVSNGMIIDGQLAQLFPLQRIKGYEQSYENVPEDLVVIGTVIGDDEKVYFSRKNGKIFMDEQGGMQEYDSVSDILEWIIQMLSYSC